MHVKVDYSSDCKKHGYDTSRPGSYAIYTRKHFWNTWVEGAIYTDLKCCKYDAMRQAELPIHYR